MRKYHRIAWQYLISKKLFRFIHIGVINTIFGYGVFVFLYTVTNKPYLSVITTTIIGVLFNFFTTGRFVFDNQSAAALLPFVLGYTVILGVNIVLLDLLLNLGIHGNIAQGLTLPVTALLSYLINSHIVFKDRVRANRG